LRTIHGTQQVHLEDGAKVFDGHLRKALVTQNSSVVDQNVDSTPRLHRILDHAPCALYVGNGTAVGDRLPACSFDFVDDPDSSFRRAASAIHCAAEVIYDDLGAASGEFQRMAAAQTATRTRYDGNPTVKAHCHVRPQLLMRKRAILHTSVRCMPTYGRIGKT